MCIFETNQRIQQYPSTILNVKRLIRLGARFTGFLYFTPASSLISAPHMLTFFSYWHDNIQHLVLVNCYHMQIKRQFFVNPPITTISSIVYNFLNLNPRLSNFAGHTRLQSSFIIESSFHALPTQQASVNLIAIKIAL